MLKQREHAGRAMTTRTRALTALTALIAALAMMTVLAITAQRGRRDRRNRFAIDSTTLASIISLECPFSSGSAGRWKNGPATAQTATQAVAGRISIRQIDVQ